VASLEKFEAFYLSIKSNRWYWLFSIFCRVSLAFAFIVAGLVKVTDERFASGLSELHPMGAYLEALHHTGYYYTFIGIAQIIAALLLLIPRTVTLGALLYFPIIVNIWILSYALRFDGSYVTAPLMVLANLFLLVWNYDRLKYLLPTAKMTGLGLFKKPIKYSKKFPFLFCGLVFTVVVMTVLFAQLGLSMPRNSLKDCKKQFTQTENEVAGYEFCECIHIEGKPLDECLTLLD
jgi:uncharacterized membrane protein YphA (DoxX/SURF4 family)